MLYFEEGDLKLIFGVIEKYYTSQEEVPNYFDEEEGVKNLLGVFDRVRMEYYPALVDKIVYLFVQINKGHFFSNGNKRLALVVAMGFMNINNKKIAQSSRNKFKEALATLFPGCEKFLEDQKNFSPEEYALYNLSIIVADSHKYISSEEGFDTLKKKVVDFFNLFLVDWE